LALFMLLHRPEVRGEEARAPAQEDGDGVRPGAFLANPRSNGHGSKNSYIMKNAITMVGWNRV